MTPVEGGNDRSLLAARIASLSIAMVGNAWGIGMGIEIDRAARSRPVVFHGIVFCHDQLDFGPLARSESECGDIRTGLRRVTCRTVRVACQYCLRRISLGRHSCLVGSRLKRELLLYFKIGKAHV